MGPMKEEREKDSDGGDGSGSATDGGEGGNDWKEWIPIESLLHCPPDSARCIIVASIWCLLPNVAKEDAAAVDAPCPTSLVESSLSYSPPSLIIKDPCQRHRVPPLHSVVDMPMPPMKKEREKDSDGGDGGGSAANGGEGSVDRRE